MKKIIMLKALPGAGKSTLAKQMQEKDPNLVRVNRDTLREMLHNGKWSSKREKQIVITRDNIIRDTLLRGHSIIVDDTNLSPNNEKDLRVLAGVHGAEFEVIDLTDVPLETCIERDLKRPNSVGSKVIMRMYNQFLKPKREEKAIVPYGDSNLPTCIISDLDGTLACVHDRNPYDGKSCGSDLVNISVAEILSVFKTHDVAPVDKVILFSGRNGESELETKKWLEDNGITFDELYMRKPGDSRKDSIIKEEMFNEYIEGKYQVLFIIDDRKSVKRMWVSKGIPVLDVNQFDEEF